MQVPESENNLFTANNWKLHGELCKQLSSSVQKIIAVIPILEGERPGTSLGLTALCALHVCTKKANSLLEFCCESSKLYLALTGDSILTKFEKTKMALLQSVRRVQETDLPVTRAAFADIAAELEKTVFALDQYENSTRADIIELLQKKERNKGTDDSSELEMFHQIATKLNLTSSRASLTEKRALKKLLEKSKSSNDKTKEAIITYLLNMMQKYSKACRTDLIEGDTDSGCSTPSSELAFNFNNLSTVSSFSSSKHEELSRSMPIPPEELRCPISLQLMFDPVVISSGQTYDRVCIEKWFKNGHTTCPKTQQELAHLFLTPNICVKDLITSWCDQNGVPAPQNPPDSPTFSPLTTSTNIKSETGQPETGHSETGHSVTGQEEEVVVEEEEEEENEVKYKRWMDILSKEGGEGEIMEVKRKVVEEIRFHLKTNDEGRSQMAAYGFTEPLLSFFNLAIKAKDEKAQVVCAIALFNLAVNNFRNKELCVLGGVIPLIEEMMEQTHSNTAMTEAVTALYQNLSLLDEAQPLICQPTVVEFLLKALQTSDGSLSRTCRSDAFHSLFNLSNCPANVPVLFSSGILHALLPLLKNGFTWADKAVCILINLALDAPSKTRLANTTGLLRSITALLDSGSPMEQEQAASFLFVLCSSDEGNSQLVLQEGPIPPLVILQNTGTTRARDKAENLLRVFREQRPKDPPRKDPPRKDPVQVFLSRNAMLPSAPRQENYQGDRRERRGSGIASPSTSSTCSEDTRGQTSDDPNKQRLANSRSRRLGRALTSMWKHKKNKRREG